MLVNDRQLGAARVVKLVELVKELSLHLGLKLFKHVLFARLRLEGLQQLVNSVHLINEVCRVFQKQGLLLHQVD